MLKINDLKNLERCENSYFLSRNIVSVKDIYYYMSIGIKNAVIEAIKKKKHTEKSIKKTLSDSMPDNAFLPLVKETNVDFLAKLIVRYLSYLEKNYKVIDMNLTEDINVDGEIITVSADLVLRDIEGMLHVVKLKRSSPKLSYTGRKYESIPSNNIELYALKKLGDKKYGEAGISGAFHHMEGKNDKKGNYRFEEKKGYNIISCDFSKKNNALTKIKQLTKTATGKAFSKTKDKSNCRNCPYENICNYNKPTEIKVEEVKETTKEPSRFVLTPSQRKAVLLEKGISRINAGAGSGKTTVVALRVNELILNGCDPKDILMTTFTNKGAQEMRDKVRFWLKKEGQEISEKDLNITTFNSWGDKIIKENYKELGFNKEPQLIDKVKKYDILFEILENNPKIESFDYKNPVMNYRYAQGAVSKLSKIFDFIKANNVKSIKRLEKFVKEEREAKQVLKMYKEYSKILKEKSFIEYQDQINIIMQMMEDDNPIMHKYDYKHIITDEFQDTDAIQIDLIMYLANQPSFKSLMVVGDDSQSIFGFRNTTQENILNFHKLFNKVKDIQIVENFRSTPEIVDVANYLNSLNEKKLEKKLISGKKNGKKPKLVNFKNLEEEHKAIAEKIKKLIDEGHNEEDIAVIARTKYELFDIQKELEKLDIAQVLDIPEPLLNNTRIHMAKNLAEFIEDRKTNQGLYEYLMILTGNFEGMNEEKIEKLFKENIDSIKKVFEIKDDELKEDAKKEIFFEMLEVIQDKEFEKFREELKEKNLSFKDTKSYLRKFVEYEDPKTVDKNDKKYRAVTLTTAHTSKGKEFDVVFNSISKYKPDNRKEAIEEERRLLFVSITRAKDLLYITYTNSKRSKFSKKYDNFFMELYNTHGTRKANKL